MEPPGDCDAARLVPVDGAHYEHPVSRVAAEQPRLEALVGFMQKAPDKIKRVPAVLFPAEQRDEVLDAIARQVAAMQSALAAMPDLAASLRTLGSEPA